MSLTPVANGKIFNHKRFNYFVWTSLGRRVNLYIFAFKFTLRSQQPDIVPIICHWYQCCDFKEWKFFSWSWRVEGESSLCLSYCEYSKRNYIRLAPSPEDEGCSVQRYKNHLRSCSKVTPTNALVYIKTANQSLTFQNKIKVFFLGWTLSR